MRRRLDLLQPIKVLPRGVFMIVYKEYNRASAVAYARRWALSRNPLFTNFAGRGGDCTNFISQCVYAGT